MDCQCSKNKMKQKITTPDPREVKSTPWGLRKQGGTSGGHLILYFRPVFFILNSFALTMTPQRYYHLTFCLIYTVHKKNSVTCFHASQTTVIFRSYFQQWPRYLKALLPHYFDVYLWTFHFKSVGRFCLSQLWKSLRNYFWRDGNLDLTFFCSFQCYFYMKHYGMKNF